MDLNDFIEPELREPFLELAPLESPAADPAGARQRTRELVEGLTAGRTRSSAVERVDTLARGVPVRVYRPRGHHGVLPSVVFVHGGGFVVGDLDTADDQCEHLAETVPAVVVSVDYRLAPEHPFPAAVEDCYTTLLWLVASAKELGVDRKRIAIAGESAGGGVAAGLVLLARDRREVGVAFQLLSWACLDDRHITSSSRAVTEPRVWNRAVSQSCWRAYLGDESDVDVPAYAAPARAEDLRGLPPTYISIGQLDLIRDENIEYARRLMEAGVRTELHVYPGGFHGFEVFVPTARISIDSRADRDRALIRNLTPPD